jgi:hypothetical protein
MHTDVLTVLVALAPGARRSLPTRRDRRNDDDDHTKPSDDDLKKRSPASSTR